MDAPTRIRTLAQFRAVVSSGTGVVITDSARQPVFHPHPERCAHVEERYFAQKVTANAERNGSYFAIASIADARERWPNVSKCGAAACSEGFTLDWGEAEDERASRQERLSSLLREATGVEGGRPRSYEPLGAEVMLGNARSTQRVALGRRGDSLSFCSWPGELKRQARALYRTDRAARLLELVGSSSAWVARPKPHLAYFLSKPTQNLYLSCGLGLDEYVRRWSESDDFDRVGGSHRPDALREDLWPWLHGRGFIAPGSADDRQLDDFIQRLGQRGAHLRPGIEVERVWPLDDASELDRQGELVGEVRVAAEELLTALREPSPPRLGVPDVG